MKKEIALKEVINLDQWQKIQDHFGEVLGVTIRTVDETGKLLTKPSKPTRLCNEVIQGAPEGIVKCAGCLPPSTADLQSDEMWQEGYLCHSGLHNFSFPVKLPSNKTAAYVLVGPVLLGGRQKPKKYREKITELGIDPDKFTDALIEIKVFSFSGIQSVLELLQDVTSYIVELGYHSFKFKLEKLLPLPKLSKRVYKFYTDRLLNALLDVSFNVTAAEFGSIMLLDEKTGELYIKIGRGIKKDIIKNTRVKIGEGLAGLSAKERKFLLLDNKMTDERIKNRLNRPEIKSAIVAPIQVKDELFGVMNIATLHSADKFNYDNIDVLRQLVKLVTTAVADTAES